MLTRVPYLVLVTGLSMALPCALLAAPTAAPEPAADANAATPPPAVTAASGSPAPAAESGSSVGIASGSPVADATGLPVVAADKLIPILPEPPAGWKSETPEGDSSETDGVKLTTAERTYFVDSEADDAPSADITIIDTGGSKSFYEDTTETWKTTEQTPDGYDKPIEIDGIRAYEHYDKESKGSSLSLFVANRYFVQIDLTNLDPKELQTWFKRIDVAKLAAVK